tara:strand:+ start:398 stop:628 length:231 start_codon:yes stop_codon:yes gene_type:complete
MTDQPIHQVHLQSAQQQQQQLLSEIQELNNQVSAKRELVLKVQGVIEYLQQIESSTQMDVAEPVEEPVEEPKKSKS